MAQKGNIYRYLILGFTILVNTTVLADVNTPRFLDPLPVEPVPVDIVIQPLGEKLASQDKALTQTIHQGRRYADIVSRDDQIEALLDRRYRNADNATDLRQQFANTISIQLRQINLNSPLETERWALRNHSLAAIDLALGRQFARYADAVRQNDKNAQIEVLTELQNGLLLLSADQVERLANQVGRILQQETRILSNRVNNPQQRQDALIGILNPALIVFDTIKHRGPNALYDWLRQNRHLFTNVDQPPATLYVFDRISGVMLGFEQPDDILRNMDELLDPANIAWGHCGLGQMAAAGLNSGNFACAMGPQCRANPFDRTGLDLDKLRKRLPKSEFDKYSRGNSNNGGKQSPYGVSQSRLQNNCRTSSAGAFGSGGKSTGSGGGMMSPGGGGSFAGCLANAMYHDAMANDPARCHLRAAQKLQDARRNESIIVTAGKGGPVIRGIYGNGDCGTNPRMQGGGGYTDKQRQGFSTMGEVIHDFADKLADENDASGRKLRAMIDSVAGRDLSEEEYDDLAEDIRTHTKICAADCDEPGEVDAMADAKCGGNPSRSCEVEIHVDAEDHVDEDGTCGRECQEKLGETMTHETAAHGGGMVDKTPREVYGKTGEDGSWEAKSNAEQEAEAEREHERYDSAKQGSDSAGNTEDKAQSIAEDIAKQQQQPNPLDPPEMCGPVAEAYRDMMQCSAGTVAGFDDQGNPIPTPDSENQPRDPGMGNTDGNVDPSQEQWLDSQYGNNAFARCTRQQGITIVGSNGQVYVIGGDHNAGSGQQCGALDCMPPARARKVNGLCTCVALGRDAFIKAVLQRHELMRTCAVMTVNCDANPGSPCCGGHGGRPAIDIDNGPGDPSRFDRDNIQLDDDVLNNDDVINPEVIHIDPDKTTAEGRRDPDPP